MMQKARNVVHALAVIMIVFSPQVTWAQEEESCTDVCHAEGMQVYDNRRAAGWSHSRAQSAGARAWGACMIEIFQGVQ